MTPDGYVLWRPALDDLGDAIGVVNACDLVDVGFIDAAPEELEWYDERLDLSRDAWLVYATDGAPAAYARVLDRFAEAWVHPEHRGRGLGTELLRLIEARATEQQGGRGFVLKQFVCGGNDGARSFLERNGYRHAYFHERLALSLAGNGMKVTWPEGIVGRSFEASDGRAVFALVDEVFKDIGGYEPDPVELWLQRFDQPDFAPHLSMLAHAGDELVGFSLCGLVNGDGWIRDLGVRRNQRGKGLGRALLRSSFASFAEAGIAKAVLSVSSLNTIGARQMYEADGMTAETRYDRYEKDL